MKIVNKVWGTEEWIVNNCLYCGKRMTLLKGAFCSLHMHPVKHETFFVESGRMRVEILTDKMHLIDAIHGSIIEIAPGTFHRFAGYEDTVFFEFSSQHSDDDVVRKEESYLTNPLWVFDVDGTLYSAGGIINAQQLRRLNEFGILSSRSEERSREACMQLNVRPNFVITCRVKSRSEELKALDHDYPLRRTIYVADQESDRSEALLAGWQHMYPNEFCNLMMEA